MTFAAQPGILHSHQDGGVEVLHAPKRTLISKPLYDDLAAQGHSDLACLDLAAEAGEGWFVINATNGVFRYRIVGEDITGLAYEAVLHDQQGERDVREAEGEDTGPG